MTRRSPSVTLEVVYTDTAFVFRSDDQSQWLTDQVIAFQINRARAPAQKLAELREVLFKREEERTPGRNPLRPCGNFFPPMVSDPNVGTPVS